MTLYEAKKGARCLIKGLYVEPAITRRLEALGLNDGTTVSVLNRKKHGAMIIQVRGTRLALGKHISSNIEIKQQAPETRGEGLETEHEGLETRQESFETEQEGLETEQEGLETRQESFKTRQESFETKRAGSGQEVYK